MKSLGKLKTDRLLFIKTNILEGKTFNEVGLLLGLSRQRVAQIFNKFYNIPRGDRGVSRKVLLKKEERQKQIHDKLGRTTYFCQDDITRRQSLLFSRKRESAKRTKHEWSISLKDIEWPTHCPVLGLELDYYAEVRQENSPSFDRTNSKLGYIPGNVKIISWRANRIKNNGSREEHLKIAEYLSH